MFAGYLGYFGYSSDLEYNKKVDDANKLVDEYNQNINLKDYKEELVYQFEMKTKINKILGFTAYNL